MTKRGLRWQFLVAFLFALSVASISFGEATLFQHQDETTPDIFSQDSPIAPSSSTMSSKRSDKAEFDMINHSIQFPTISSGTAQFMNITNLNTTSINGTFIGMGRNRIINGDMTIDQSNAFASQTVNTTSSFWGPDANFRAIGQAADGVYTMQDVTSTPPTGFSNYTHFVVTTADASIGSTQFYYLDEDIEGYAIRDFLMGTSSVVNFTFSFWTRSSLTGTFGGAFVNASSNRSYPFTYVVNSVSTWEKKVITIQGDTTGTWNMTNGVGMSILFDIGSGSSFKGTAGSWSGSNFIGATGATNLIGTLNATWDITGLQLEIGPQATAFEYRPPQTELALCQRYYETASGFRRTIQGTNGVGYAFPVHFSVPKVAAPSMTIVGGTLVNVGSTGSEAANTTGFTFIFGCNGTSGTVAIGNSDDASWKADSRI